MEAADYFNVIICKKRQNHPIYVDYFVKFEILKLCKLKLLILALIVVTSPSLDNVCFSLSLLKSFFSLVWFICHLCYTAGRNVF